MTPQPDIMYVSYYTAGSAAYKLEQKPVKAKAAPVHKPRQRVRRRTIAVDPVALCGIVAAVCLFVALIAGVREYRDTQLQNQQMHSYVEQLKNENAALQEVYENSYDPSQIREMATAIGMVPQEQLQHISIRVEVPQQEQPRLSFWENIALFLSGLFA